MEKSFCHPFTGGHNAAEKHFARRPEAFTLVEVVLTVATLAIVVTVAVSAASTATRATEGSKLESDTGALNRAVTMYIASGGDLTGASTPAAVLTRLKTNLADAEVKTQINPLTRSLIDARLTAEMQTDSEALSDKPRVYWNAAKQQFELKTAGGIGGVRRFVLLESTAAQLELAGRSESRSQGTLEFASVDGWIWDHGDRTVANPTPTVIPTSAPTTPPTSRSVPVSPSPQPLFPPTFSIPGSLRPATDFDLSLSLSNPNPAGSSIIQYSIDSGPWITYPAGGITVPKNATVRARTVSTRPTEYYDSSALQQVYLAELVDLDPPAIAFSADQFTDAVSTISVTLSDANAAGLSDIYYDIVQTGAGFQPVSSWRRYTGSFNARVADYPDGFDVIAYAKAVDPTVYVDSPEVEGFTTANFFGVPITEQYVLLVIDASGSMSNPYADGLTRFEAAIDAAIKAVESLNPRQHFNVAFFDDDIFWTDGTFKLHITNDTNKQTMITQLQGLRAAGTGNGTSYKSALALPPMFDKVPETVIFLTDGRPNSPDYDAEVQALADRGMTVHAIGIGLDDAALGNLDDIVAITGGSVTNAE